MKKIIFLMLLIISQVVSNNQCEQYLENADVFIKATEKIDKVSIIPLYINSAMMYMKRYQICISKRKDEAAVGSK